MRDITCFTRNHKGKRKALDKNLNGFYPKKRGITKGKLIALLAIINVLLIVVIFFGINSYGDMMSTLGEMRFENLILKDQKSKLEEDITYLETSLSESEEMLKISISKKDAQIDSLNENITLLNSTNAYLKQDLMNSDDVRAFLLFDKYPYSGISAEDLLYLNDEIKLYDNLSKRDDIIDIILGIYYVESRFDPTATSTKSSARGWGQFIKSTAKWIWEERLGHGSGSYNHDMAFDKHINMTLTVNYMSYLLDVYDGDVQKALIAYNGSELGETYPELVQKYVMTSAGVDIINGIY